MKKLSQTWRQKPKFNHKNLIKVDELDVPVGASTPNSEAQNGTPRRSERLANSKNQQNKERTYQHASKISSEQCSLFKSSFGFEFDADALAAVDKMEEEHARKEVRPLMKPDMSSGVTNEPQIQFLPQNSSHSNMSSVLTEKPASLESEKPNIDRESSKHSSSGQAIQLNSNDEKYEAIFSKTFEQSDDHRLEKENICKESSFQNNHEVAVTQGKCELTSWGLPDSILEEYKKIGISTMFEWQAQCLCTGNVLNGGNLVYSAPTSAGKTMVAEILILKRILEIKCKALFILPFVSVAREKMFYLQRMFGEAGIKVDGYMGSLAPTKGFDSIDIAVCTIEKANGLVNRLMESGQLHDVGVIVVDEIHLIGDTSRGYLLELLLTKVLYMSQSNAGKTIMLSCERNVQIIGMSATLPNLNVLATWLRADLYYTNYRPVPLTEAFKVGPVIYDRSENVLRVLSPSRMISGDDDHVLLLCQETVQEGNGVLVFCPTKSWCEKLAESIAKHFYTFECKGGSGWLNFDLLKEVFEQLRSCQVGVDHVLGKVLRYGVAYHHAGLTYDERDIIEAAFKQGVIKVVVATSTLSSGVNLPARRVLIRTPMFHGKLLDGLVYKQMSGRAGRKGVDSQGESILLCKTNERQKACSLFQDDLKPVKSCLVVKRDDEDEGNGIKRALLEVIAGGVATTPADVQRYAGCTLYVSSKTQEDGERTRNIIESTVGYLEKNEFITLRKKDSSLKTNSASESYVPTQLGQATLASSLSPDEALVVFTDLRKARKCFVLENELHILYQVTPIYVQDTWPNLDWYQYLRLWERLPSHMKRVAELVGVEEGFLSRAIHGRAPKRSDAQRHALRVHKRFYVTLALHDLVHETPLDIVARRYGASRGMLQSLQSSAATFAGMVTVFCHKLGWNNLEMLLAQFQKRLTFGVERELCDIIRISSLNAFRARVLYTAGYHTVAALAAASPSEVEKHLRNATPFQSKKKSEGETEFERRKRMRAKCIWVNGGKALTEAEAAQAIVKEACAFVKEDASKLGIPWQPAEVNGVEQDSENISKVSEVDRVKKGDGHNRNSKRNFKGTPKKKPHNGRSFKRKHTLSNSPKDCSRPKMKLNDKGTSLVVDDSKECALEGSSTTKDGCKDNFYSDCVDNFKIRDGKTPTNRTTRNVLPLEISADIASRSPAKKVPLVKTTKFACKQIEVQSIQGKSEEILSTTNELLVSDQKSKSENKMKDQESFIEKNTIEKVWDSRSESPKATGIGVALKLNHESLHTPTGKQIEFKDESPELICESSNTTPVTKSCTRRASSNLLVPSPELSSERLFPDSEELFPDSPAINEGSFNMQTGKISESTGLEIVDTSMQDLGICEEVDSVVVENKLQLDVSEKKSLVASSKAKGGDISDLVFTPDRILNDKKPDTRNAEDVCSPSMFDSSPRNSESSPRNSELSRGSPNSFALKLSESSDDSASESNLSTRTFATVAALDEHKIVAKDNHGDDGTCEVDDAGSQELQEVSRTSQGIMAAIEGTDNELHHKVDASSVCEPRVPHESSLANCFTKIIPKPGGTADCSKPIFNSAGPTDYKDQPVAAARSHVEETAVKKTRITERLRKSAFEVIDIAKDRNTFDRFIHGCKNNSFSFSVAVERRQRTGSSIGRRFNKGSEHSSEGEKFGLMIEEESLAVTGIAVCWEVNKVYFISFEDHTQSCGREEVSMSERLECVECIMGFHEAGRSKTAFGMKEQYKLLSRACGVIIKGKLQDPKIATWLHDPAAKEKNFVQMIEHFLPQKSHLLPDIHGNLGHSGLGQAIYTSLPARERSCLDAVFTSMLMDHLRSLLQDDGLWQAFRNIEMAAISCLARMELNGFGFSNTECEKIKQILRGKLRALEQEAYKFAKHAFSLTSPEDVSRVLFLELKLPPNGNTELSTSPGKVIKPTRGGGRRKVKYFSTSKDVLERLIPLHPLPQVVLEWRRVNSALTKIVFPVQKEQVKCGPPINMSRIFPTALTHTATGRVTFVEPNLQNVPRDFDINLPSVISDTPPTPVVKCRTKSRTCIGKSDFTPSSPGPQFSVSLRSAFVSVSHGILLAADYSQLELRLIAHLSSDGKLASFLNAGGDAFKMIAGELFRVTQNRVSDEQRQRAKHVCYGIIYGIGAKALGQTLGVNENEAALFVDAFKARFTGVCAYLKKTVEECRRLGYVTTISRRRRYIPNIRASNAAARSQAERQAVNTTVQGSAADLVKLAMSNIDRRLCEEFPDCWRTHRQKSDDRAGRQAGGREGKFRGANLVLQLHDELLFEVAQQDFFKVVKIVKHGMEDAMKLSVQLPVKLKSGKSWGTMEPLEVV